MSCAVLLQRVSSRYQCRAGQLDTLTTTGLQEMLHIGTVFLTWSLKPSLSISWTHAVIYRYRMGINWNKAFIQINDHVPAVAIPYHLGGLSVLITLVFTCRPAANLPSMRFDVPAFTATICAERIPRDVDLADLLSYVPFTYLRS